MDAASHPETEEEEEEEERGEEMGGRDEGDGRPSGMSLCCCF